jgi:hypothetical protein
MYIDLLHGLATPREPLAPSEFVASDTLIFREGFGAPQSTVLWKGDRKDEILRVREVSPDARVGATYVRGVSAGPLLFDNVVGTVTPETGVAVYVGSRDRLTLGVHNIQLAWTVTDTTGSERIEAITSHVVRVLPRRPVGTWSDDAVPAPFLDRVLSFLQNTPHPDAASAFQAIAESLTRAPGQLAYDERGDALAAPDLLEFDAYLNGTGDSPARGNDRGGLILDLASKAMTGAIYRGFRKPKVWIDCHGLAQLMTLIGQLLGLPVERWTLTSTARERGSGVGRVAAGARAGGSAPRVSPLDGRAARRAARPARVWVNERAAARDPMVEDPVPSPCWEVPASRGQALTSARAASPRHTAPPVAPRGPAPLQRVAGGESAAVALVGPDPLPPRPPRSSPRRRGSPPRR